MKNFKLNKEIVLWLIISALVIVTSTIMRTRFQSIAIEESVNFNEVGINRTMPFTVQGEVVLLLAVESEIEEGFFGIRIISPSGDIVYEKHGANFNDYAEISVYDGIWSWHLEIYGLEGSGSPARNGRYSIIGNLE